MAVCKGCRCAKNRTPCVSCYPARRNKCANVIRRPQDSDSSNNKNTTSEISGLPNNNNNSDSEPQAGSSPTLMDIMSFSRASILNRIPKGSRNFAAASLNVLINNACDSNNSTDWQKHFRFTCFCLKKPKRGGKRRSSLASVVNQNIRNFMSDPLAAFDLNTPKARPSTSQTNDDDDTRCKAVAKKLACGDIKGAIRLLSSNNTHLPCDENTLSSLQSKHPPLHPDSCMPASPSEVDSTGALHLNEAQIRKAISSFPAGSAGGLDRLLPQHLKDMISKSSGDGGYQLLTSVTCLCNKMLKGDIPPDITSALYGASLMAFSKPNGGVRPIAVGNTLRRLTAKAAAFSVKEKIRSKLSPLQLGVSVSGGAEAIVHAGRSFCNAKKKSTNPTVFLKIF